MLIFLLPLCMIVIVYSLPYVAASWRVAEGSSESAGLPLLFLLKSVIPLSFALLALQGLSLLAKALLVLTGSADAAQRQAE